MLNEWLCKILCVNCAYCDKQLKKRDALKRGKKYYCGGSCVVDATIEKLEEENSD